jgi:hypothetical protein
MSQPALWLTEIIDSNSSHKHLTPRRELTTTACIPHLGYRVSRFTNWTSGCSPAAIRSRPLTRSTSWNRWSTARLSRLLPSHSNSPDRSDGEHHQNGDGDEPGGVRHADVSAHGDVMSDLNPTAGRPKPLRKETGRQESRAGHGVPVSAPPPDAAGHPRRRRSRPPPPSAPAPVPNAPA